MKRNYGKIIIQRAISLADAKVKAVELIYKFFGSPEAAAEAIKSYNGNTTAALFDKAKVRTLIILLTLIFNVSASEIIAKPINYVSHINITQSISQTMSTQQKAFTPDEVSKSWHVLGGLIEDINWGAKQKIKTGTGIAFHEQFIKQMVQAGKDFQTKINNCKELKGKINFDYKALTDYAGVLRSQLDKSNPSVSYKTINNFAQVVAGN